MIATFEVNAVNAVHGVHAVHGCTQVKDYSARAYTRARWSVHLRAPAMQGASATAEGGSR